VGGEVCAVVVHASEAEKDGLATKQEKKARKYEAEFMSMGRVVRAFIWSRSFTNYRI